MPGCMLSATKASFSSVEKRRLRATPVFTSTFENVSDIGTCLGLSLGPPAKAGVRSKRGAVHSLSGGGYLGLYSACILTQLEDQAGVPPGRRFDLICGTSIGGILALGLA